MASADEDSKQQAARLERLRKMLLSMAEDIRVVLILLAQRVTLMRRLDTLPMEERARIAAATMDLYAPLANRLGIWQVKWELEDLAFRHLESQRYLQIEKLLSEHREEREKYIAEMLDRLRRELAAAGIEGEITGRSKHIYSIWKKMRRKGVRFEQVYDVRAVRVLVNTVKDCYAVLGLVHNLWEPVSGEYDDYIAKPKANNYRSLHTAVIVEDGLTLEVQIRTHEMHNASELGVAAHWRYKEGGRADRNFDEKILWLRQLLEWKADFAGSGALPSNVTQGLFDDQVFVLTPQGRVIDLPAGSTPIDFAYHVHTDLGHRCRGAKVDGQIVPLTYRLQNAQRVEVVAAKDGGPSRDWLNPALGFLHSPRALAKVRHWFRLQFHEQEVADGRAILEKELARLGQSATALEKVAEALEQKSVDSMLAEIGRGEIAPRQIEHALAPPPAAQAVETSPTIRPESRRGASGGVLVLGVNNIATVIAKCCKPVPPDAIIGFVTRGRGVAIHRADCDSIAHLDGRQRERLMPADWGNTGGMPFAVDIEMTAEDRTGLLRDITEALSRERINVTATNSISRANLAHIRFTIEVLNGDQLGRVLRQLGDVRGVIAVSRR